MNTHSKNIGRECIKRAKAKYGVGWMLLGEEAQRGAIAFEVVSVLLAQSAHNVDAPTTLLHCQDVARAALYAET